MAGMEKLYEELIMCIVIVVQVMSDISKQDCIHIVCEIPRIFELASPSNFRTQGSFIHIK